MVIIILDLFDVTVNSTVIFAVRTDCLDVASQVYEQFTELLYNTTAMCKGR